MQYRAVRSNQQALGRKVSRCVKITDMQERNILLTAFVLRHHLLGEADKIVVLFSRERGLRRAVAKGVRRPKSTLAGRLEPFIENRVELLKGRSLDKVVQLDTLQRFPAVLTNLDGLASALSASELLLGLLQPDDPHPDVYDIFVELLQLLAPEGPHEILSLIFELQVLAALGYRPSLAACSRCDAALTNPSPGTTWDAPGGGCVCRSCSLQAPTGLRPLSPGAWQLLRRLQHTPLRAAPGVTGDPGVLKQARSLLTAYTAARTERDLKARRMLDWAATPSG